MTRLTAQERAARRHEIIARWKRGESQYAIAKALGVSRSLIQKELREVRREHESDHPRPVKTLSASGGGSHVRAVQAVKNARYRSHAGSGLMTILPPPDHFSAWRRIDLDKDTWGNLDPNQLTSLLINISPEVSRMVWDYLRLLNGGHEINVYRPTSDEDDPDPYPEAKAKLMEFVARLEEYHGSFKALAGEMFMTAITRGALFGELVLNDTGTEPVDIALPDPAVVRFRRAESPERGEYWQLGQWQDGKFVDFDTPTVRYIGIDRESDNPYGRPLLSPAVFPTVFLMGLLGDLRRVVAQQGYPRMEIIVKLEQLREMYHDLNMKDFEVKVDELLDALTGEYGMLEPDDAFAHTDTVELNHASGAIDTSALQGAGDLIEVLERMAVRALKSTPLMMGLAEGTSEANANRQWEIFAKGVRSLQHDCETILGRFLELALQVQGIVAKVEVRFAEVRSTDELRDEQTFQLKLGNAIVAEQAGYMSRDEAAMHAVGHGAVTNAPLQSQDVPDTSDGEEADAEPGENRAFHVVQRRDGRWQIARPLDTVDWGVATSRAVDDSGEAGELGGPRHDTTSDHLDRAIRAWEAVFAGTRYANLLLAEVVDGDESEDEA